METFSTGEGAKIIDVSLKRFVNYINRGIVEPYEPAGGRGRPAKVTLMDIVKIRIIIDLSDFGLDVSLAGAIASKACLLIKSREKYVHQAYNSYIQITVDLEKLDEQYFSLFSLEKFGPSLMKEKF